MRTEENGGEARMSGFDGAQKPLDFGGFSTESAGQSYPHRNPQGEDALGEPLAIRDVAKLLGCSPWTIRHSYLPKGLPHLRSGPLGKLIFYRTQVVRWILHYQQKGGR